MNNKLKALLTILLVIGFLLIPSTQYTDANGWLEDYTYRKQINITGEAGAGTDYRIPLTVYKTSTAPTNVEQTDNDAFTSLMSGALYVRAGQRMTIQGKITNLSFYLSKTGTPVGDITFAIRRASDDSIVYSDVWGDAGDLSIDPVREWKEVTFSNPSVVNEEVYLSCEYSNGDLSNYVNVRLKASDVKADEHFSRYSGGVWGDQVLWDCAYKYTYNPGIIFLNDHCTDFPNDIRFTDDDGTTELDPDITGSDADIAKFLIEVADDLGNNQSIYIYYGKLGAGSGISDFREDWLDYTEVDVIDDVIQRIGDPSHHIDHDAYDNDEAYVYKNFTEAYFTDFEHQIQMQAGYETNAAHGFPWTLTEDTVDDIKALTVNSKTYIQIMAYADSAVSYRIVLAEGYAGFRYQDTYTAAWDTPYYLTIKKVGTALTCEIYSDATRETLLDTLTSATWDGGALHADHSFQYAFPANTWNDGTGEHIDVDTDDHFFRFIVDPEPVVGTPGSLEFRNISHGYIIG